MYRYRNYAIILLIDRFVPRTGQSNHMAGIVQYQFMFARDQEAIEFLLGPVLLAFVLVNACRYVFWRFGSARL